MSEVHSPRRILHLIVEGFPPERTNELSGPVEGASDVTEVLQLTEASAPEALEKIFAADTVAVWGKL